MEDYGYGLGLGYGCISSYVNVDVVAGNEVVGVFETIFYELDSGFGSGSGMIGSYNWFWDFVI